MADNVSTDAADRLAAAKSVNQYITDYIKVADAKIAGYVTISTGISAVVLPNLQRWLATHPITGWYQLFYFLLGLSILFYLGTLVSALCALSPKVDPANSMVSFPDISSSDLSDYTMRFCRLSNEEILTEYIKHNKTLALIAMSKFKKLKYATNFSFAWISLYVLLYLIQVVSSAPSTS